MSTNFGDGIPLPPASRGNRRNLILRVGLFSVVFVFLFISSIILLYLFTKKSRPSSSLVITRATHTPPISLTSNEEQPDELPTIIKVQTNSTVATSYIAQNVEYRAPGKPLQNYKLYVIDATLLAPNTSISFDIIIFGPNLGCDWSLDVFPMDGRTIPMSGISTGSTVFGLYDQLQGSAVYKPDVSTVNYWSAGTGKFAVGISGSWYGSAGIGCRGAGKLILYFSRS